MKTMSIYVIGIIITSWNTYIFFKQSNFFSHYTQLGDFSR